MITSALTLQAKTLYSYEDDFYAVQHYLFPTSNPAPDNSARYVRSALCIVAAIQIIAGPAKVVDRKKITKPTEFNSFPTTCGPDDMEINGVIPIQTSSQAAEDNQIVMVGALQLSLHSKQQNGAQIFISKIPEGNLEDGKVQLRANDTARCILSDFITPSTVPRLLFKLHSNKPLEAAVRLDVQINNIKNLINTKQKQSSRELLLFTFVPD